MGKVTDANLLSQLNGPSGRVTDPALLTQLNGQPVTAGDRLDAAEGGFLGGMAHLVASPLDVFANAYNLGKAGLGYGYSKATGHAPPSALEAGDPNPVGNWLTSQMDKSELLHTNARHPEDAPSRWLHTAGGVVPGALAGGGGSVRATAQALLGGEAGGAAAQGVHEWQPFTDPTKQNIAETGAGLIGSLAGSTAIPGRPINTPQNLAVMEGQGHGYKFPSATTNPTPFNKLMARVAGGATVQDEAQAHNQPLTNAGVREDLSLPGEGPLRPDEIQRVKTETNAAYNSVENSGASVPRDARLIQALQKAKSRYTNTSTLSPSLASSPAATRIDELMGVSKPGGKPRIGTMFNAKDGVATTESLRDAARTSARNGEMGDATAYRQAANAVEDAMDRALSQDPATASLVDAWRTARIRRAQLHSAEDAMDANGNVDATKLGKAYADDAPLSGNMAIAARSANAAPKAFRVPETGPTGGHGGFWGPLTGAVVGGEGAAHIGETIGGLFGHPEAGAVAGATPLAAYGGYIASRAAARRLALARMMAVQREAPNTSGAITGAYTGALAAPVTP